MNQVVNAGLVGIDDPIVIGAVYTYLIQAADELWELEKLETYNQELIDRLKPYRNQTLSPAELARVNSYLGFAELSLGNIQFAAVYLEDLASYEYTTWNAFILATTYDLAGNHGCAFRWYQNLLAIERDVEEKIFSDLAKDAISRIKDVCGECGVPGCP